MTRILQGPAVVALLGLPALPAAFQGLPAVSRKPLAPQLAAATAARTPLAGGTQSGTPACAAALGAVLLGGLAACNRRRVARRSFSSSGSGFLGMPTAVSFGIVEGASEERQGAAGMSMKNQVWWIKNNGFDGHPGKVYDSRRRESRRRGEELFRHDVDNFELTLSNLKSAPGGFPKRVRRGRGAYGSHGRTCGYGNGGAKTRGRRTVNPGYEGGHVPLHHSTPILTKAQRALMRRDPYTIIKLPVLNLCDDGDEVDFQDLLIRGFPVRRSYKYDKVKVKAKESDVLETKNLTVYAHAFEPAAREKIEDNGGKCVRLHEWSSLPLDENATQVLIGSDGEETESAAEEE